MNGRVLIFLCVLFCSSKLYAFEIGVGIDDNQAILLPVRVTDGFMLELSYRYRRSAYDIANTKYSLSEKSTRIGLGIFGLIQSAHSMEYSYGIQLTHLTDKSRKTSVTSSESGHNLSGLTLAPFLGAQYRINPVLSVGLEASYYYSSRKRDYLGGGTIDFSFDGTDTRIVARAMF